MFFRNFFIKLRDKLFLNAMKSYFQQMEKRFEYISAKLEQNEKFLVKLDNESAKKELLTEYYEDFSKRLNYLSYDVNGRLCTNISRLFSVFATHSKVFPQYKGIYRGKSVVIVGAGPTVNDFVPIKNSVYIGLNRAFKFNKINFDYLFAIDKCGIKDYYEEFFNYRNGACIKFIGDQNNGAAYQIPEGKITGDKVYRYLTTASQFLNRFTYHIDSEPLGNYETVSLQAMQFVLYTNPAKIYLVGIDCTPNGHFTGKTEFTTDRTEEEFKNNMAHNVEDWNSLKDFASTYYPDTQIISVNPVGLKGIFKDWYQAEGEEPK